MPIRHTIVLLDPTDISAPPPAEALSRPRPPPAARCGLSAASWAAYAGPSRQRQARQEWLLLRVTSVVLILLAGAMAVFIALMIAGHH